MRFLGADAASNAAIILTMVDDKAFVGGAELEVDANDRVDLSLGYEAYVGSRIETHTAHVRVRMAF